MKNPSQKLIILDFDIHFYREQLSLILLKGRTRGFSVALGIDAKLWEESEDLLAHVFLSDAHANLTRMEAFARHANDETLSANAPFRRARLAYLAFACLIAKLKE